MIRRHCYSFNFHPLIFIILLATTSLIHAGPLRVGFLCPNPPEKGFWNQVIDVMQAAAMDLKIELLVKCDKSGSTLGSRLLGEHLLNSEPKLDYFLTGYWPSVTKHHLTLAKKLGIKVFIFNADIMDVEKVEIGQPREKFDNWIGHMVPDDKTAAKELTRILVSCATQVNKETAYKKSNIYAFFSDRYSSVSRKRQEGFREQARLMPQATPHEIILTTKKEKVTSLEKYNTARERAIALVHNSPDVNAIYTRNQAEMWGAIQGVEQAGKLPGKDVFIGGYDWNPGSLKAVADGRITATMFGHFIEGVWALLLVHDYNYGFDFEDDVGLKILTPMLALTPQNYEHYKVLFGESFWGSIDFKRFSKKYNPTLKSYNFDIGQFLDR